MPILFSAIRRLQWKHRLRLACSSTAIWDEWLTRRSPFSPVQTPTRQNSPRNRGSLLTCTGWSPPPRRSSCRFWVCAPPACAPPPRRTASACTWWVHSPTLAPATSAPPRSSSWGTADRWPAWTQQKPRWKRREWTEILHQVQSSLRKVHVSLCLRRKSAVWTCAPFNKVRAETEGK